MNLDYWEEQIKATVASAAHLAVPVDGQVTPTLTVTKRASADVVRAGEQLTYTIRVTNTGDVDLHVTVTDVLPSHVSPGGVLTWTATVSGPGGVWEQTSVVTVEMSYSGVLTNVVQVTSEEGATGAYVVTCTAAGNHVYLPVVVRNESAR